MVISSRVNKRPASLKIHAAAVTMLCDIHMQAEIIDEVSKLQCLEGSQTFPDVTGKIGHWHGQKVCTELLSLLKSYVNLWKH